jgi:hypothetical protein
VGHGLEPDQVDDLVHPVPRQAVALGEGEQVGVGRAAGVAGPRVDQRPHPAHRVGEFPVRPAEHARRPRRGAGQAEDAAHRRRLARAVGAEEAGDPAGLDGDRQAVDGDAAAIRLRQPDELDHAVSMASGRERAEEARPVPDRGVPLHGNAGT